MLKSTSRERFKKWSETASSSDKFIWEGKPFTKKEFEEHHNLVSTKKTIKKDIEEKVNEELEREFHPEHIEESGDGTGEG